MFDTLSDYKKVNSGGRYQNNVGGPVVDKYEFQRKHKFVIAFENTSSPGYTTEKLVHAFSAGAVPIYWGDPRVNEVFNEGAFINCMDFGLESHGSEQSIKRIVDWIKQIDEDDELYKQMLKTPAFVDSYFVDTEQAAFEKFLLSIFEQSLDRAYQRNRYRWGERYERKQRIGNKAYWLCRKVIPLRDSARKLLKVPAFE